MGFGAFGSGPANLTSVPVSAVYSGRTPDEPTQGLKDGPALLPRQGALLHLCLHTAPKSGGEHTKTENTYTSRG